MLIPFRNYATKTLRHEEENNNYSWCFCAFVAAILILREILLVFFKQLRVDVVRAAAFWCIAGGVGKGALVMAARAFLDRLGSLKQILAVRASPFGYI